MRTQLHTLVLTLGFGAAMLVSPWATHAAEGLRVGNSDSVWPQWQARLAVNDQPLGWSASLVDARLPARAATLAGDRYFDIGRLGDGGGLRATGALSIGSSALALGAPTGAATLSLSRAMSSTSTGRAYEGAEPLATPYVGMGYSAWWARSNLGLSADLGLAGQWRSTGSRPDRISTSGSDSLMDMARTMQWAPVLKVQLSYTF